MPKNNKIFRGNETAIRACIYYEYLNGMPIFDSPSSEHDLNLMDLPIEVIEEVIQNLDVMDREWHYLIRNSGGHQKMALEDLKIVLKNPKLKLEFLEIQNISPAFFSNIHEFFKGFSWKISVKEIKISTKWRGEDLKILEYFSSKTVEFEISESYKQPNQREISNRIEEIVDLDHEFLKMTFCIPSLDTFPIFYFEECRRVALHFQHLWIRGEDVFVFLKRILQSSKIQLFIVTSSQGISSDKHGWDIANLQKISDDFYEFPISNEEFFEVEWSRQALRIERKTIGKNN
ncbi:hypothetical protein CAEBREN_07093 [Caenorhabditis brenneri]|uniref:F-box domain-containing protein n=1 Tax=Caenorhabditis brenneri TaxID=135651 RepID=G0P295_CAEBE|nr:hypothetical protein CAEBREN_07093 [Caenorhabditis brenneri]